MPRYYVAFVHAIPYYRCNDNAGQYRAENPWRRKNQAATALNQYFDLATFTDYIIARFPTNSISLDQAKAAFDTQAAAFLRTVASPEPGTTIDLESDDDPSSLNIYRKIGTQHIGGPLLVLRNGSGDQVGVLQTQVGSPSGPVPAYIHILYGLTDVPPPTARKRTMRARKRKATK